MAMNIKSLWTELKRRKVLRTAGIYLVAVWGVSTGAAELMPTFGAPDWAVRALIIVLFLGLPVVVALAWSFDLSAHGVIRDSGASVALAEPAPTIMLSPTDARAHVRWTDGGRSQHRTFSGDFVMGRDPACDVHLDNGAVSRRHARAFYLGNQWFIEDLQSQNGTFINEARISREPLEGPNRIYLSTDGPVVEIEISAPADDSVTRMV